MKKVLFLFIALILFKAQLFSWWDNGHMVVANIAEKRLTASAKKKIEDLIHLYPEKFPHSNTFLTAATWADDASNEGIIEWEYHREAKIYDPENILSRNEISEEEKSATMGIGQAITILRDKESSQLEKATMLRLLLHLVGDIHMPMHCATLYNQEFPEGDRRGTEFKITVKNFSKSSLHSLWDSILLRDDQRFDRPLTKEGKKYIETLSQEVLLSLPEDHLSSELLKIDPESWAEESYQIAIQHAYQNIQPSDTPSQEYLEKNRRIAMQRLSLAGYRLSNLLNDIFTEK